MESSSQFTSEKLKREQAIKEEPVDQPGLQNAPGPRPYRPELRPFCAGNVIIQRPSQAERRAEYERKKQLLIRKQGEAAYQALLERAQTNAQQEVESRADVKGIRMLDG